MKKIIASIMMICILFSATGCVLMNAVILNSNVTTEKTFTVDNYGLQITADSSFKTATEGDFDLQITNNDTYISIMAYNYIDLPSDLTPSDVYEMQNEDLFSRRTNVTVIEEQKSLSSDQCTVTYAMYSAEKDKSKNYYAAYLIDFPSEETFAWVLVTAMPSVLEANREYLHNIVCSLTPTEQASK